MKSATIKSMNDQQFDDLKQFIATTVGQTEARLEQRIEGVENRLERLDRKMDDGFAGISEVVETINTRLDDQDKHDKEIERQLTTLKTRTA